MTLANRDLVVVLGPQPEEGEGAHSAGGMLAELGIRGKVALVHAGYQERESEDAAIIAALGVPTVNLRLHQRATEVFAKDPEFSAAYQARQQRLRHMQSFYRVRLEKTEDAARSISVRYVDAELLEQEEKVSVDQFRQLDLDHMERCAAVRAAFLAHWRPHERELIARHRAQLKAELADCQALVISGGHVASLLNRLALFDVLDLAAGMPVLAWSAGAMVLTDRIVLFHDFPPYGSDTAQMLDAGFGRAPGIIVLPDPRRRVNLEARSGIQRFARRMAPATCVAMDVGAFVVFEAGRIVSAQAIRLTTTGDAEPRWDGEPSRFSTPYLRGVHV